MREGGGGEEGERRKGVRMGRRGKGEDGEKEKEGGEGGGGLPSRAFTWAQVGAANTPFCAVCPKRCQGPAALRCSGERPRLKHLTYKRKHFFLFIQSANLKKSYIGILCVYKNTKTIFYPFFPLPRYLSLSVLKTSRPSMAALLAALPRPCLPWTLRGPEHRALERPRTCPGGPWDSCFNSQKVFAFFRLHVSLLFGLQSLVMGLA